MPRVEASGPSTCAFANQTCNGSSTFDVCKEHGDVLTSNPHAFDGILKPYNGDPDPEDGFLNDGCLHPPYGDSVYRCAVCGKLLTDDDD